MNNKIQLGLIALTISLFASCNIDNFTSPDDPKYDDLKDDGIVLNIGNTYQVIDHFGASGGFQEEWIGKWPDESKNPIAELLFSKELDSNGDPKGIGLTMWRSIIGDGSADQVNSGYLSSSWFRETECYLNASGTYDWTKQSGTQWFLQKAQEYGVNKFTAWATTPPYFMTKNGYTFRTPDQEPGFNCPPSNYENYASFLSNVMQYYQSKGYNFEVVCPFNETQYEWSEDVGNARQSGTQALNSEVAAVTRIINDKFIEDGVQAKIMIPEAGVLNYLYEDTGNTGNQIHEFFNSSSNNYVGNLERISKHIAGHSYWSNNTAKQSIKQRESVRDALMNNPHDLDFWQTEYSIIGTAYQQMGTELEDIDYALWLSKIIHTDLVLGNATGWSFWSAFNQSAYGDHPYRFNLISYQTNANNPSQTDGSFYHVKNLWALGNYSRFLEPGAVRFDVEDSKYTSEESVNNFMVSGYLNKSSNELVLICVNMLDELRELTLQNYGEQFSFKDDKVKLYTTSKTSNLESSVKTVGSIVIPKKSIVTIKGALTK